MRRQLMQAINDDLHNMEATGKVNLEIIDKLNQLRKLLDEQKNKWLKIENTDSYYFYQGLKNIELMLDKMEYRFKHAPELHDNPKIAADSQILFTFVNDLIQITESNKMDNGAINNVLHKTQILRNAAVHQNLIESPEVDDELIDKENLRLQFRSMMNNIDIPQQEEPTIDAEESEDSN